jgi:hypothetical protein
MFMRGESESKVTNILVEFLKTILIAYALVRSPPTGKSI